MNNLTSRQRKFLYLAGMILLLLPIAYLAQAPEPALGKSVEAKPGGLLARMRDEYGLGESDLGNVDPASSTMNLLLLGFRGIATCILWTDAQEQQRHKDWAALRSTTESIILLQPHFLKVWYFTGWNLAYNVSAEWDAVADRYYWVKEGIKFFKKGRDRNEKYAELYWYIGDTTGKKIGRSDEWKQFRRFFRKDPDEARFQGKPDKDVNPRGVDNYEEAHVWFLEANNTVDKYGHEQHIMARYLFRAYPARAKFDYAAALQREGTFDEVGRNAWREGFDFWTTKYGREEFECPVGKIHLEVPAEELARMIADEEARDVDPGQRTSHWVNRYQNDTNYRFWRTKAHVESQQEMSEAHREMYLAEQALFKADTATAREKYLSGMTRYEKLLAEYSDLKDEDEVVEEGLIAQIGWREALALDEEQVPDEFPLKEMWESHHSRKENATEEFNRRRRGLR